MAEAFDLFTLGELQPKSLTEPARNDPLKLTLYELKSGMTIRAYLDLEQRFGQLDDKKCEWLKHNFTGARIALQRDGQAFDLALSEILPGDVPQKIFGFPHSLDHLTQVNDRLLAELGRQGFTAFEVQPKASEPDHAEALAQANQLVSQAKQGKETRKKATVAVETLFDSLASGAPNLEAVETLVEEIIENSNVEAMAALATLKQADHTYAHCVDVGAIFTMVYQRITEMTGKPSSFKDLQETLLSAILHDIGKSLIPKEILESSVQFDKDSEEMKALRSHAEKSRNLLADLGLPEVTVNMGHYHHVKVDTEIYTSYPKGLEFDDATYEARLLAIIDIYQALTGRRSYKKSWTAAAALRYIDALVDVEYDERAFDDFSKVMGLYPVGSLVQLSDGRLGFVMNVPTGDLERPKVAVFQDAQGNALTHELVDLAKQSELSIQRDLDPIDTLGEAALDRFVELQLS